MSDIFISYSRKDSTQALDLAAQLRTAGMDVWIDQHGIEAATSWSNEIVEAIDSAKVMLLLLSASSVISDNVVREISLAFEAKKTIIPIDLEAIALPTQLRYQLAGIQRAQFEDFEGILRSLTKLGIAAVEGGILPVQSYVVSKTAAAAKNDTRKSLMILPFEDLSPDKDNAWFADGLLSELISSLSNIKLLRLMDQRTSRDFKNVKAKLTDISREYDIRYFIEGTVRKFGEQIKISLELLDIESGNHLWQYSHKGAFADIFEVQESVAEKVVEGLKLHLTKDELEIMRERGTENAEAYELAMKGAEYHDRQTKEDKLHAIFLYKEALKLDPHFVGAHLMLAGSLTDMYRLYDRDPEYLEEVERLLTIIHDIKPSFAPMLAAYSILRRQQGRFEEAETFAKQLLALEPELEVSHLGLGFLYSETDRCELAIPCYEEGLRLKPDNLSSHWGLVILYDRVRDAVGRVRAAERSLPYFEKHNRLFPDDTHSAVCYANLLFYAEQNDKAAEALERVPEIRDGNPLFNLACLAAKLGRPELAINFLQKSSAAGYAEFESYHSDPDLDSLREREDFLTLVAEMVAKHGH